MRIQALLGITVIAHALCTHAAPVQPLSSQSIPPVKDVLGKLLMEKPITLGEQLHPIMVQLVPKAVNLALQVAIGNPLDEQAAVAVATLAGRAGTLLIKDWWKRYLSQATIKVFRQMSKTLHGRQSSIDLRLSEAEVEAEIIDPEGEDLEPTLVEHTYLNEADANEALEESHTGVPANGQMLQEQEVFTKELLYQLSRQWTYGQRAAAAMKLYELQSDAGFSPDEVRGMTEAIWDAANY